MLENGQISMSTDCRYHTVSRYSSQLQETHRDLDTYLIDNPDDELCTISAHDLTPKLITFLN